MFDVKVNYIGADAVIKKYGFGPNGATQRFFTSEVMRLSDNYVPRRNNILKNSAQMTNDGTGIIYKGPYARYHWFGKVMVDPITGKGSFYDPISGRHWSRPNTKKVLTDRDMQYNEVPMRGPRWVERMWLDNKDMVIKSVEEYAKNVGN